MTTSTEGYRKVGDHFHKCFFPDTRAHELYQAYFREEIWTLKEFGALTAGLTPDRLWEIEQKQGINPSPLEVKQASAALGTCISLMDYKKGCMEKKASGTGETIWMTCWQYIKWLAESNTPIRTKFFRELPMHLMEVYLEFTSPDQVLRTKRETSRLYHKTLYLKHASELMKSSETRLSRKQIYDHPAMQAIMDQFQTPQGGRASYKYRTITSSWLAEIDKQKRGRPKIQQRTAPQ
ncbi:MAG: hypothetical protein CMO81_03205 [Waddliaceae bacterium]|nr:hypothetical protein [Waddliaceae bacterium]